VGNLKYFVSETAKSAAAHERVWVLISKSPPTPVERHAAQFALEQMAQRGQHFLSLPGGMAAQCVCASELSDKDVEYIAIQPKEAA